MQAAIPDVLKPKSKADTLAHKIANDKKHVHAYGTAGFRASSELLPHVMLRVGFLSVIRCISADIKGKAIGVMITASHNPEHENGVKIVDPKGEMLASEWEPIATDLVNAPEDKVCEILAKISADFKCDWKLKRKIFVGRDTRPSSSHLSDCCIQGCKALGADVVDVGVVTTPQLHYVLRSFNLGQPHAVSNYYTNLSTAFVDLLSSAGIKEVGPVILDCANGVGAKSAAEFAKHLSKTLKIELRNNGSKGLNDKCGAEHVQKTRSMPLSVDPAADKMKRFASVDGDADRLVYFYFDEQSKFHLIDGDKIIALSACFLKELLTAAGLDKKLTIGVVQTAYANGASTQYIEKTIGVPVHCQPTGVKFLHHEAEHFDIGIYFEANGHGTIIFSEKAKAAASEAAQLKLADTAKQAKGAALPADVQAARNLLSCIALVNQAVGDAISDMLFCEVALALKKWTMVDWNNMYHDLPSKQLKVAVKDRSVIQTTDAERKCTAPAGLQDAIDKAVAKYPMGRSFARPSGTENVVRVYSEAETEEAAQQLGDEVCKAVSQFAG